MKIEIEIPDEYIKSYPEVNWSYLVMCGTNIVDYYNNRKILENNQIIIQEKSKKKKHNRIDYYALAEDWYNNYYINGKGKQILKQEKIKEETLIRRFLKNHLGYPATNKFTLNKFKEAFESYLATHNGHKDDMEQMREN